MKIIGICALNELYKIFKSIKYRLMLIITSALNICVYFLGGLSGGIISFSGENYPYFVLSVCCYLLIPFTSFSLLSDLIAGEYERNEFKLLLTRHINRNSLLIGKLISAAAYETILTFINVILAAILTIIYHGMNSVSLGKIIAAALITLLPIIAVTSFSGLISVICKTGMSAFWAEIAVFVSEIICALVFSKISRAFFTSYLAIYKMIIGRTIPVSELIIGAAALIGTALFTASCACMIFEKRIFDFERSL